MKKHLLLLSLLAILTPVSSQTLTICQAFDKLLTNVNDFKPLMGEKDPNNPMAKLSTIQVEGASSSNFFQSTNKLTFEAKLGSFQTNLEASSKRNELLSAMRVCYPNMTFSIKDDQALNATYSRAFPVIKNETLLRVYEASFCIQKIATTYDLVFEFPQAQKASILSNEVPTYTDYTLLTATPDFSEFADSLFTLFEYASEGFEKITGSLLMDKVEKDAVSYNVSYKLPGCTDSYVEQNLDKKRFYIVQLCKNVDASTLEAKVTPFVQQLLSALGKAYAYKASANGRSMDFVQSNNPLDKVFSLEYTENNDKYSARLVIYSK